MYETLVCEILLLFVGSVSRTDCSLDNGLDLVSTLDRCGTSCRVESQTRVGDPFFLHAGEIVTSLQSQKFLFVHDRAQVALHTRQKKQSQKSPAIINKLDANHHNINMVLALHSIARLYACCRKTSIHKPSSSSDHFNANKAHKEGCTKNRTLPSPSNCCLRM